MARRRWSPCRGPAIPGPSVPCRRQRPESRRPGSRAESRADYKADISSKRLKLSRRTTGPEAPHFFLSRATDLNGF